jgi:hypothetical protein
MLIDIPEHRLPTCDPQNDEDIQTVKDCLALLNVLENTAAGLDHLRNHPKVIYEATSKLRENLERILQVISQ